MVDVLASGSSDLCYTAVSAAKPTSAVNVRVYLDKSISLFNISMCDLLIVYRHQISKAIKHQCKSEVLLHVLRINLIFLKLNF